jgi:hypothetical protein
MSFESSQFRRFCCFYRNFHQHISVHIEGAFQIVAIPVLPDFTIYMTTSCYSKHIPVSVESCRYETSVENHIGHLLNPEGMTYRFRQIPKG